MKRTRKYLVRPAAENDLKDIGRHTRQAWGREQARRYLRALHEKMQSLAANPNLGVVRDDVAEGYRSARVGHHHIFYRTDRDDIVVVRVLHESMDVQRHLDVAKERDIEVPSPASPTPKKRRRRKREGDPDLSR